MCERKILFQQIERLRCLASSAYVRVNVLAPSADGSSRHLRIAAAFGSHSFLLQDARY